MQSVSDRDPLADLDPSDADALRSLGTTKRFAPGQVLLLEGSRSDHVLVLRQGRAKITSSQPDGRVVLLAVRGPVELMGELSSLDPDGAPHSATVVALDEVTAQVVPNGEFVEFLRHHPNVLLALTQTLITRLRESDRRRIEYGSYDTLNRVARALADIAEAHGVRRDGHLELSLTQEELAGIVAASRESVARALRTLREQGMVQTSRRSISVTDPERLRSFGG
ncbi:MAG: Crp/Fnr family transcriptional regulator [Actinomycetota bacterium]|nr:Crp/Fnr family transcriptional regulator [Actinomycetota bacterium]